MERKSNRIVILGGGFAGIYTAMPSIGLEAKFQIGDQVLLSSNSSTSKYSVVFEDDGTVRV